MFLLLSLDFLYRHTNNLIEKQEKFTSYLTFKIVSYNLTQSLCIVLYLFHFSKSISAHLKNLDFRAFENDTCETSEVSNTIYKLKMTHNISKIRTNTSETKDAKSREELLSVIDKLASSKKHLALKLNENQESDEFKQEVIAEQKVLKQQNPDKSSIRYG